MPFKSKAQRRKFAELLVSGKITPETFEEWNRETGGKSLPERLKHRATRTAAKRKTATPPAAKPKAAKRQAATRKTAKRKSKRAVRRKA